MTPTHEHRAAPKATELARDLRAKSTPPEQILWKMLRNRRLGGMKFRRQVLIGPFLVDFYCAETNLVVELDGESHNGRQQEDAERTSHLEQQGLRVVRITNHDLLTNPEGVWQFLLSQTTVDPSANPHPSPLPGRERESNQAR
ncbi:MAG: endonuclease domain-containing protein [Planctomycetota bacterium]